MADAAYQAHHPTGREVAWLIYRYLHNTILSLYFHLRAAIIGVEFVYVLSIHDFDQPNMGPGGLHRIYGVFKQESQVLMALEVIRRAPDFAGKEFRYDGVMRIDRGDCGVPVLAPHWDGVVGRGVVTIVQRMEAKVSARF